MGCFGSQTLSILAMHNIQIVIQNDMRCGMIVKPADFRDLRRKRQFVFLLVPRLKIAVVVKLSSRQDKGSWWVFPDSSHLKLLYLVTFREDESWGR